MLGVLAAVHEHSCLSRPVVFLSAVQPQHGVELALRPATLSAAASLGRRSSGLSLFFLWQAALVLSPISGLSSFCGATPYPLARAAVPFLGPAASSETAPPRREGAAGGRNLD